MSDILIEIQGEVTRLRNTINMTKAVLPNASFIMYEVMICRAGKAIREHDTTELIKLLPTLQEMQ